MQSADTDLTRGFFWKKDEDNSLGFYFFHFLLLLFRQAAAHSKPPNTKDIEIVRRVQLAANHIRTLWSLCRSLPPLRNSHFVECSVVSNECDVGDVEHSEVISGVPSGVHTFVETISIKIFVDRLWTENNLEEGLIVKIDLRSSNDNGCCHPSATAMWAKGSSTTHNTQVPFTLFERRFYTLSFPSRKTKCVAFKRAGTVWAILWFELKHLQLITLAAASEMLHFNFNIHCWPFPHLANYAIADTALRPVQC